VCRALVAEALELSSFLERVSQGTYELREKAEAASTDLDKLQFSDWVSCFTMFSENSLAPVIEEREIKTDSETWREI
jgi:hypothetical protein